MSMDSNASSKNTDYAVVISSCDAYSDLWPYFFHFFFKHWPQIENPIYLISNHRSYYDPRVKTILVGKDLQWGTNTQSALREIKAERILFLLDDFLFNQDFDQEAFEKVVDQHIKSNGRMVELRIRGQQGEAVAETWFRRADATNLFAGLNSNLFTKELLSYIAQPGLNIWQCESRVRDLLREGETQFFFMDQAAPPILSFVESVRGQFWKPEGLAYLRSHQFEPDLKRRPCPPQGDNIFSKALRSYFKAKMKRQRNKRQSFTDSNLLVYPLK